SHVSGMDVGVRGSPQIRLIIHRIELYAALAGPPEFPDEMRDPFILEDRSIVQVRRVGEGPALSGEGTHGRYAAILRRIVSLDGVASEPDGRPALPGHADRMRGV